MLLESTDNACSDTVGSHIYCLNRTYKAEFFFSFLFFSFIFFSKVGNIKEAV